MRPSGSTKPDKAAKALTAAVQGFRAGDAKTALRHAKTVLRTHPRRSEALQIAGVCAAATGDHPAAVRYLERLLEVAGTIPPDVHRALATALRALDRPVEATQAYRRAVDQHPDDWQALNDLGTALAGGDTPEDAIPVLEKASGLAPSVPEIALNLGNAHRAAGHLADAETAYRRAIAQRPAYVSAHANLAALKTFSADDPDLDALRDLSQTVDPETPQGVRVAFALSKAYQDLADFQESYAWLARANRSASDLETGDSDDDVNRMDAWRSAFASGPKLTPMAPPTGPIFVMGMPRSGTTLVERLLSAHPDVYGAGERHELRRLVYAAGDGHLKTARSWFRASDGACDRLARAYRGSLQPAVAPYPRWVDKMPFNVPYIPLIRRAFPDARIIVCRRHPVATCFSIYQQNFRANLPWTHAFASIAATYRACTMVMDHWQAAYPDFVHTVDYDLLAAEPQVHAADVFAACGLTWSDRYLDLQNAKGAVHSASAVQVRRPISSSGVDRWRNFAPFLGDLFAALDIQEDELPQT